LIIGVLVLGFIAWWLMKRRKENTGAIDDVVVSDSTIKVGSDYTQGELFEQKFGAIGAHPCYCNGEYKGLVHSKRACRKMCRFGRRFKQPILTP
jgi:hypothetical protein